MSKKILVIAILFCSSVLSAVPAHGQLLMALIFGDKLNNGRLTFGIALGENWSSIAGYKDTKALKGFAAGLHFAWKVNQHFYLQGEAMASNPGGVDRLPKYSLGMPLDSIYAEGTLSRRIPYFGLTLAPRYHFYKSLFAEGGIAINMRSGKASDKFEVENDEITQTHTHKTNDGVTRFDVGVIGGVGCVLKNGEGIKFGVRTYYGFVDVIKNDAGMNNNSNFSIFGAIPVGRNKAKAKQAEKAKTH